MMVREAGDGGADVLVTAADAQPLHDWSELPTSVVDELQALPDVVDRALA
jgi:hypothetical protein